MQTEEERKQEQKKIKIRAAIFTGIFNALLLVALIYTLAWAPPDPPLPEYGIEVNFGLDEIGTGDIQNKAPANDNESFDKAKPNPPAREERQTPTPEPKPDPIPEPVPVPVAEPVRESTPEPIVEPVPEVESEAVVKPIPEKSKVEPKPVEVKKPVPEKPKTEQNAPTPTEEKPAENVNTETLLPSSTGTANEDQANNNGEGTGQVGDQGNPQGDLNADALLGSASGGGGAALDMPGWRWDQSPDVVDKSAETGKVVFEIKIDDEGEVISVKTIYRSVSKAVANVYQQEILNLTFTPDASAAVKPITTGRITFIITSR